MPLVEGVGDEVLLTVAVLTMLAVLTLAWLSTRVADSALVVLVDRHTFNNLLRRIRIRGATLLSRTDGSASLLLRTNRLPHQQTGLGESVSGGEAVFTGHDDTPASQSLASGGVPHTDRTEVSHHPASWTDRATPRADAVSVLSATDVAARPTDSEADCRQQSMPDSVVPTRAAPLSCEQAQSTSTHTGAKEVSLNEQGVRQRRVNFFQKQDDDGVTTRPGGSHSNRPTEPCEPSVTPPGTSSSTALPPEGQIRIRLKYLDDRQKLVQARPGDTVAQFKSLHFSAEMARDLLVRCVYNGQELRQDSRTLAQYNVVDNSVIHCLMTHVTHTHDSRESDSQAVDFDMGRLMLPLFALLLGLIWYCRCVYRLYFNAMSTFALVAVTFMYGLAAMAAFRNRGAELQPLE